MHRVSNFISRSRLATSSSTQSLDSLSESHALESALRAVELIMDDDIAGAEAGLQSGTSAFHKLARGTLAFMKAALGFEQEVMKDASDQLYEAESTATQSLYKAQHDSSGKVFVSGIYEMGSEFMLCQAESQVMMAVVGVLNESLTESIKGFYRLRKAYITLDNLAQMEDIFMKGRAVKSLRSSRNASRESLKGAAGADAGAGAGAGAGSGAASPGKAGDGMQIHGPSGLRHAEVVEKDSDDEDEFFEADEAGKQEKGVLEGYSGRVELDQLRDEHLEKEIAKLNIPDRPNSSHAQELEKQPMPTSSGMLTEDADSDIFTNSLDVFIHSGTNLMFGVLNLMISVVPPAFSKLLFIVGFRGDRERGLRMLWQASKFHNVNGGMAGLVIFGWYNGLVGFCDIIPDSDPNDAEDTAGYPFARLQGLLVEMRKRYPKSYLWLVEEARMAAARRDLPTALDLLSKPGRSKMKQLEALHMFEMSLDSMYAHRYERCADSFIKCVDLNAWSQALYYYIAGAAHVAAYRECADSSSEEAKKHKKMAEEYIKTAPSKVGRKKMMGRQLPFDLFVVRKIAKWEERQHRWGCDFVDAIGVNPLEEMIYLWGGFKKMDDGNLEHSMRNLAWSEGSKHWKEEDPDEPAILALLRSVVLRNSRQYDESMELLRVKLLDQDVHSLKGHNRDDWPMPAAHHEMAVNLWMMRTGYVRMSGSDSKGSVYGEKVPKLDVAHDAKLVQQAKQYLEKAKNWERYELDARLGMKITAALSAIKRWEQKHLTSK